MVYRVKLGYNDFDFKDATSAIGFAEQAKSTYVGDKYDKTLDVRIKLMNDEQTEEEEE